MIRPETEGNNLFYCAFIVVVENTSKCVEIRKKKIGRLEKNLED